MSTFTLGLDLGQRKDYTALSILERTTRGRRDFVVNAYRRSDEEIDLPEDEPVVYHLRHLERFRLGTSYPAIVERVKALVTAPELAGETDLVVDATGVGAPVLDMLRAAGIPGIIAVTITGGDQVARPSYDEYRVPKRDLVSTVQVVLQTKRLRFAKGLREGEVLERELMNFRA